MKNDMPDIKKCMYCGCKYIVIENNRELRCDDCDMILAVKDNGVWEIWD